ncbi:complement component C6-like [Scleropages formosus]|uniref:Complement component C6-like n=1 Tax=Scleropages formosus TaxID=113540 RepID=A0A0P7U326_SCLFO|nr:complement component C6-like [Scleropages formosus]
MDRATAVLTLLTMLWGATPTLACFCDHYPWTAWSTCSRTCNYGTQQRHRTIRHDEYYWKNACEQLCVKQESRACNVEACPLHCHLSEYGPWSACSSCAKKQFRTRELVTPAQFGGSDCTEPLVEERPCHPSTECHIEKVDCKDRFTCDNGRCISTKLRCNSQNDCGDNSDERHCARMVRVCNRVFESIPGAELMASGFDAAAEKIRAAVLDNSFFGGECTTNRSREDRKWYRIPANVEEVQLKVEYVEDYKAEAEEAQSEVVNLASDSSSSSSHEDGGGLFIPILFSWRNSYMSRKTSSFRSAVKASQQKDSKFIRVHQAVRVSTFRTKSSDLYLSEPFLRTLSSLPLDYNYALYRQVFQLFGTHYFKAGTLGGHYDLLYQYNREEVKNSGERRVAVVMERMGTWVLLLPVVQLSVRCLTDSEVSSCVRRETSFRFLIFFSSSRINRQCYTNKMSEKYEGSFLKASERSISMVRGGRAEYAAALAIERQGVLPDSTTYKDWMESTKDNPTVVEYELRPILELVRGFPCAVTKRQHLERALIEYLESFDSCKCAPCPNNARPVLSGTECLCVCQSGTYGPNCERRAQDYTSSMAPPQHRGTVFFPFASIIKVPDHSALLPSCPDAVDGRWSCWGPWSTCDSSMRRQRVRECNNPAPQQGGKACPGERRREEDKAYRPGRWRSKVLQSHVGLLMSGRSPCPLLSRQDVCISDDETVTEDQNAELPPGTPGCSRPKAPPNSYLRYDPFPLAAVALSPTPERSKTHNFSISVPQINKRRFSFGDTEEILCLTGFEMEGYQYIRCMPDSTWSKPMGQCIKRVCPSLALPEGLTAQPEKAEYRVGDTVILSCESTDMVLSGRRYYTCGIDQSWEPALTSDLHCKTGNTLILYCTADQLLSLAQNDMSLICALCGRPYREDLCVLDAEKDRFTMMSACAFHAGRCHGDRLYFLNRGACEKDESGMEWTRFRARLSDRSSVQEPCGDDTCYEWEICSEYVGCDVWLMVAVSSGLKKCECKLPRDCPKDASPSFCLEMLKTRTKRAMSACSVAAMKCAGMQFRLLQDNSC